MDEGPTLMTASIDGAVTTNHELVNQFSKYRAQERPQSAEPFHHPMQQISLGPQSVPFIQLDLNNKPIQSISRLPVSRTEPASSSSSGGSSPKCPEKPPFISTNTSFHANEHDFDKVKASVCSALDTMTEYDWSYFAADCMWKIKYFHGSSLREKYIYCYWDSSKEDHIIEVKRVRGDGVNLNSAVDFFAKLKKVVTGSTEELPHQKRRPVFGGPLPLTLSSSPTATSNTALPLPSLSSAGTAVPKLLPLPKLNRSSGGSSSMGGGLSLAPLPLAGNICSDQFISGVKPIYSMATDVYLETRIEAAKMLCDLATKDKSFVELPECKEICLKALDVLLLDPFEEVRQFAVMAFSLFMELDSYRQQATGMKGLESLIQLIRNSPREQPSYITAQMRRKAALGISLLATSFPQEVCQRMKNVGFPTEQAWFDHCGTILDKRTRESALSLCSAYK